MIYVSTKCFHNRVQQQAKNDPLKFQYNISKLVSFIKHIGTYDICNRFNNTDEILYFDNWDYFENLFETSYENTKTTVFIIDHFQHNSFDIPDVLNLDNFLYQLTTL